MTSDSLFPLLSFVPCGAYGMSVDQTIVFWNRGAERILGYSADDVLGRKCYEVVTGLVPGGFTPECSDGCRSIRYLRAGLVPSQTRLRMICSSGDRKWVTVVPMVVSGIIRDAPVLVHLFDEFIDADDGGQISGAVGEALTGGLLDMLSDQSEGPVGASGPPKLTPREVEVLQLVALGRESPQIATELGISPYTVLNHISNLRKKLNATTKLEAVMAGIRLGILSMG